MTPRRGSIHRGTVVTRSSEISRYKIRLFQRSERRGKRVTYASGRSTGSSGAFVIFTDETLPSS